MIKTGVFGKEEKKEKNALKDFGTGVTSLAFPTYAERNGGKRIVPEVDTDSRLIPNYGDKAPGPVEKKIEPVGLTKWNKLLIKIRRSLRARRDKKLLGLAGAANMAIMASKSRPDRTQKFKTDQVNWGELNLRSVGLAREYIGLDDNGKDLIVEGYTVTITGASEHSTEIRKFLKAFIYKVAEVNVTVYTSR